MEKQSLHKELHKGLAPEEKVKARAQAEMILAEAGTKGLKFNLRVEKDYIDKYIKANVRMWKDAIAESRKQSRVPWLRWDRNKWSLV